MPGTRTAKIPLLNDHHSHIYLYAALHNCINIQDVDSKEDAVRVIDKPGDGINVVLGWNSSKFTFDDDELNKLPPVIICNLSLHGILISRSAKEMIADDYKELVDKIDDQIWIEKNLIRILNYVASLRDLTDAGTALFMKFLEGQGIWATTDMCCTNTGIIERLEHSEYSDRIKLWTDLNTYRSLSSESRGRVEGVKLFTDGAIAYRTAALRGGYSTGDEGMFVHTNSELLHLLAEISTLSNQIAIHAIGDLAIEQSLCALSELHSNVPNVRMEHCQFITKEQALRAKEMGITLSMQPNFSYDAVYYNDRLRPGDSERINPFRMLIDDAGFVPGEDLLLGSDGMPHGVQFALEQSLFPPFAGQRLNLDEFVAAYCMPDDTHGHIDIEIDEGSGTVRTDVRLKG